MSILDQNKKLYKPTNALVKSLDDSEGIVEAYANIYNNEDYAGDISEPGSFVKTVDERYSKLRVYKNHNTDIELGVPNKKPDPFDPIGLLTSTMFNLEKEVSRDMFSDIKLKMKYQKDVELSIGYKVMRRDEKDKRRIKEYALWEYSFLTSWGMNPLTRVISAKSMQTELEKRDAVIAFLVDAYNLNYSDQRLINIEKSLLSLSEAPGEPPLEEPTDDQLKSLILNTFKSI